MKRGRATSIWLLGLSISCGAIEDVAAQRAKFDPPLPPPRPSFLSPPAPADHQPAPAPQEDFIRPQSTLPAESDPEPTRARLRACSVEWNRMKRSGAAIGMTWREFFRTCAHDK